MPVPPGTRYRYTKRGGKSIRLAFAPSGKVVEAKSKKQVLQDYAKKRGSLGKR
jgi:hypothetical protein